MARSRKNAGPLPDFEGTPVVQSAVAITRAGDGLSESLKIAPEALTHGQEVFYVLRGEVSQVNHVPVSAAAEALERKHTIVTQEITRVDAAEVQDFLRAAERRLQKARGEAAGISALPLGDDEDADEIGEA